jgi:hypothetical protein
MILISAFVGPSPMSNYQTKTEMHNLLKDWLARPESQIFKYSSDHAATGIGLKS